MDWNEQRARDLGPEFYPPAQRLAMKIAAQKRQNEAEAAQANSTPEAELAGLELAIAETGAAMSETQWQAMWAAEGKEAPRRPQPEDLPLSSRNKLQSARIHDLLTRGTPR